MNSGFTDPAWLYEAFDTEATPVVEFLEWLAVEYAIRTPPSTLDVGCGPGRLLVALNALGWRVVGLEPDDSYRARAEGVAGPLGVPVRSGGFNDIDVAAEFDMVLGINSSFAHVLTPGDRADALRRCRLALRPGGILVLDLPNFLRILHEYREPPDSLTEVNGTKLRLARRHTIDYHAATFTTHETYSITDPAGTRSEVQRDHVYAVSTWPELEYLILRAGFDRAVAFGSMTERTGNRSDGRIIAVARVT